MIKHIIDFFLVFEFIFDLFLGLKDINKDVCSWFVEHVIVLPLFGIATEKILAIGLVLKVYLARKSIFAWVEQYLSDIWINFAESF